MIVDDAYALQILKIGTMTPALRLDVPILVGSSTLCVEDPAIVEARSVYLYCSGQWSQFIKAHSKATVLSKL